MERILDLDKDYFFTLSQQGVKLPIDFDLSQLQNTYSEQGPTQ